jgi:branched-chain amino acid transport system substrate-binding protein
MTATSTGAPILLGVLYDFPQGDGGAGFEEALRLGLDDAGAGRIDRPVELLTHHAAGLPAGTAKAVEDGFARLDDAGVLAIVGPSISDNGLIARHLADAARIPCINYTGGELTRGEWMFHYQVGSLEEEPAILARHLSAGGVASAAVVHDQSPVGELYAEWFRRAAASIGLDVVGLATISPLAEDVTDVVARLQAGQPGALVYLGLGVSARAVALAVAALEWDVTVVSNSALMFGYLRPEWRAGWEGWVYIDAVSDDNRVRAALRERSRQAAGGPVLLAAYDIGRLLAEAVVRGGHLTRAGLRDGLERVKQLPAATGYDGTTMGFGHWDHAALKGGFLVLRSWRGERSVQVTAGS